MPTRSGWGWWPRRGPDWKRPEAVSLSCRTAGLTDQEKRLDRQTRWGYRVNDEILRIGVRPAVPCYLHVVGPRGLCRPGAIPTDTARVNSAECPNCLGQGGSGKIPG